MIPQIKTIAYATGLGTGAPYVFRYALSLARQYDAKIEIVCGMAPLNTQAQRIADTYLGDKKSDEFHRQARERVKGEIKNQVEAMCRSAIIDDPDGFKYVGTINVIEATPDQAVLQCAQRVGADVIVMGTHRRTMDQGALLGSCAVKVLHKSTIPVFLVRIPEGYADLPSKSGAPEIIEF
ncbi:nucleotide-binding universal stress protein, UspA family [Desulfuromonas soudanensis]|uniref:Nucleotide-binding universal stress protein, UspA family n=1 Tax=Desulfuromonas soudanensis TaxID=1603606 RepID=A0A0M5IMP5_9BACT|nr:universal stress protein [Desulfuromonas soudanensis]ALC15186.1 nucleotide-binding universal stress protein, UspA family [Desulfuromonas soudanensis]